MVQIEKHREHLKNLQEQYHKQYAIGNTKKCRDLKKGIRRVDREIKEAEKLMKEVANEQN